MARDGSGAETTRRGRRPKIGIASALLALALAACSGATEPLEVESVGGPDAGSSDRTESESGSSGDSTPTSAAVESQSAVDDAAEPGAGATYQVSTDQVAAGMTAISADVGFESQAEPLIEVSDSHPSICPEGELSAPTVLQETSIPTGSPISRRIMIFSSDSEAQEFVDALTRIDPDCQFVTDDGIAVITTTIEGIEPATFGEFTGTVVAQVANVDIQDEEQYGMDRFFATSHYVARDGNAVVTTSVFDGIEDLAGFPITEPMIVGAFDGIRGLTG